MNKPNLKERFIHLIRLFLLSLLIAILSDYYSSQPEYAINRFYQCFYIFYSVYTIYYLYVYRFMRKLVTIPNLVKYRVTYLRINVVVRFLYKYVLMSHIYMTSRRFFYLNLANFVGFSICFLPIFKLTGIPDDGLPYLGLLPNLYLSVNYPYVEAVKSILPFTLSCALFLMITQWIRLIWRIDDTEDQLLNFMDEYTNGVRVVNKRGTDLIGDKRDPRLIGDYSKIDANYRKIDANYRKGNEDESQ